MSGIKHEALSPHSLQKWFNTFINGKWILFDVLDNGGQKLNKAVLRKILCNYVAALHRQTWCQLTCDIWSHLFSTQTLLGVLKCDDFEALTKSHQDIWCCLYIIWGIKFWNKYLGASIHFIPTCQTANSICVALGLWWENVVNVVNVLSPRVAVREWFGEWLSLSGAAKWDEDTGWKSSQFSFKLSKGEYLPNFSSLSLTMWFTAVCYILMI